MMRCGCRVEVWVYVRCTCDEVWVSCGGVGVVWRCGCRVEVWVSCGGVGVCEMHM